MNLDISFGVDRIGETGQLGDPAEIRDEVLGDLASTSSTVDILGILYSSLSIRTRQQFRNTPTSMTSSAAFLEN